jgi:hypothetical protein
MKRNPQGESAFLVLIGCVLLVLVVMVLSSAPRTYASPTVACALDLSNLLINGSMVAADPDNGVAANWNAFVISGAPTFEHTPWEDIERNGSGTQYIWQDTDPYDAGIYQTVNGLTVGGLYNLWLGFALAAYDPGTTVNTRGNLIGRQIGLDPTGGTDPSAISVMWNSVYWDGVAAVNIPVLSRTFIASTNRATIFFRARNTMTDVRAKVWFDSGCMQLMSLPVPSNLVSVFLPLVGRD